MPALIRFVSVIKSDVSMKTIATETDCTNPFEILTLCFKRTRPFISKVLMDLVPKMTKRTEI